MSSDDIRTAMAILATKKDELELEADAIVSELTSCGPNGEPPAGLKDSLIDSEGYPRGDIDIYAIKNKRRRLAEINTDHKALMRKIESMMQVMYASTSPDENEVMHLEQELPTVIDDLAIAPFLLVDKIFISSPADACGLRLFDKIIRFGNIDGRDSKNMAGIPQLVANSVGQPIPLVVLRGDKVLTDISLVPQTWNGNGLLGCHITPIND